MECRYKGTKEFKEIGTVTFVDDNWSVFHAENLEFEQDPNLTPDHWQEVRERVAIAAMQGMLASGRWSDKRTIAEYSVEYADAIVEILKGE